MPSSVIASFTYDAGNETLRIVFVSGKIYEYKKVPVTIYRAMKASFSKGIYFNKHIRDRYPFEIAEDK